MNESTPGGSSSSMNTNTAYTPPLNLKRNRKHSAKKTSSVRKPERQIFGLLLALISFFATLFLCIYYIYLTVLFNRYYDLITRILWVFSFAFMALFYFSIITKPEYLGGDPDNEKMLPLVAAGIFRSIAHIIEFSIKGPVADLFMYIIGEMVVLLVYKKIYFWKDGTGSACLCFKPWIFRNIPISDAINYNQQPKPRYPDLIAEP